MLRSTAFAFLLIVVAHTASAEDSADLSVTSATLDQGIDLETAGWKYRSGDDASWSSPSLDDRAWERLRTTAIAHDAVPSSGWHGIGWFRLRVQVDQTLIGRPIALSIGHWGASELFVDGRLVNRFGTVGAIPDMERPFRPVSIPVIVTFPTTGTHVVAVRLSCAAMRSVTSGLGGWLSRRGKPAGFWGAMQEGSAALRAHDRDMGTIITVAASGIAMVVAFGILHGFLFTFYPRLRENLLFSVSVSALGVMLALEIVGQTRHYGLSFETFRLLASGILYPTFAVGFLAFLQLTLFSRVPRYLWAYGGLGVVASLAQTVWPGAGPARWLSGGFLALFVVDSLRVASRALFQRIDGARIIGLGVLLNAGIPALNAVAYFGVGVPSAVRFPTAMLGLLGLVVTASIHLARRVGRANRDLEGRIVEVRELSQRELEHQQREAESRVEQERERAEHQRRINELERARKLQLSMLPEVMPSLPHLDIAAYMKPATEVGGDYYDAHVGQGDTITIALGDATGHGLSAGIVVTAAKSLFKAYAAQYDIARILRESSSVLQGMNLGALFMAMQIVRITNHQLVVTSAGMPPTLVYRAAVDRVESLAASAPPLGLPVPADYAIQERTLGPGDVVMMMSDGFPERFNENEDMIGYESAALVLRAAAADRAPAATILLRFVEAGDTWANGRLQDDDVTFVVIRVREP